MSDKDLLCALDEMKLLCNINEIEMNKISKTIKDAEKVLSSSLPFLRMKIVESEFELLWNGRIIFSNNRIDRPLIECPFDIRKMIVEGNYLKKLVISINDFLKKANT